MNVKNRVLALAVVMFCLPVNLLAAADDSDEITVLSSNLSRTAISELIPMFEKIYRIKVRVQYANNPILKQQIEAGVKFDVVIIEPQMLIELSKAGFVDKNSVVDLAKIGMALVSKVGAPAVDIGSVESFRKVLLSAKSIAYTADGHSGAVFLATLEKMGLTEQMKSKLVPVVGRFSTVDVAEGTAQYTAFPLAGSIPGVQIAGMFPEEIQTYIGVSAGTGSRTVAPPLVRAFLKYLQSESSLTMFKSKGFTTLAIAQDSVPVEKEPMHRLKFENEFVRLFEVLVPAGKSTQYHIHLNDGVSVRVSNAQIIDEVSGGERTPFEIKYGEATFGARPSPLTHRVVNSGKSDFHNIFIEILPSRNAPRAMASPLLSDGHVVLIDNSRVRVNRLILKPGESSKIHTHHMAGLGIVLYDSKIEISSPGGTKQTLRSKAGDHVWRNAGTTHIIKNIGLTAFEAIVLELKPRVDAVLSPLVENQRR